MTRRRLLRGDITQARATDAVDALGGLQVLWVDPAAIVARTWELRQTVTAFDAAYVAAAELLDCFRVTADRRLASASGPRCPIRLVSR